MTDATIVGTKYVSKTTLIDKMMEIEFTTAGDYTLPAGTIIAGIITGKNGGKVNAVALASGAYTLTLALGASGVTNSVFVLLG